MDSVLNDLNSFPDLSPNPGDGNSFEGYPVWADGVFSIPEKNLGMEIYPNPARTELFVDLDDVNDIQDVQVVDPLGRIVKELFHTPGNNNFQVPLTDLIPGDYYLQLGNTREHFILLK